MITCLSFVIFLGTETVQEARGNRQEAAVFVSMLASDVYSLFAFLRVCLD